MKENFVYYLWENKLLDNHLYTVDGDGVEIVFAGYRNRDAGPDFLEARIKIGGTLWIGNVEIHVSASDWFRHKHQNDNAYHNVILHVVYDNDTDKLKIPTLVIKDKFDKSIYDNYQNFIRSQLWIPCERLLSTIQQFTWLSWLDRMVVERIEKECADIENKLNVNHFNWEETFYQRLMHYFGLKVNNAAFEQLAFVLPLKKILKHIDNLIQVEAMFFGCAGFLEKDFTEEYPLLLQREYKILKSKFGFVDMSMTYWKFLRLRPPNFPTIRLAQAAAIFHKNGAFFSKILEINNLPELRQLFDVQVSEYWETHYVFEKQTNEKIRHLGQSAIDIIIINAVIPLLFFYGHYHERHDIKEKALEFMECIDAEDNKVIKCFADFGVRANNAHQSQALLHLYYHYCRRKRCLECQIFYVLSTTCQTR